MELITGKAEYILVLDAVGCFEEGYSVGAELTNIGNGEVVRLEIEHHEMIEFVEQLQDMHRCGVCDGPLWFYDGDRFNRDVGQICSRCYDNSDHPAVVQLRELSEAVAQLAARQEAQEKEQKP